MCRPRVSSLPSRRDTDERFVSHRPVSVFAQMWQRQIETDEEAKSDVPVDGKDE